ncbi:MAG: hypothetical protein H6Q75_1503 [Firmicutes bacterium]|nr:hypothetical protein [Bacillota bacterium]
MLCFFLGTQELSKLNSYMWQGYACCTKDCFMLIYQMLPEMPVFFNMSNLLL